MMKRQPIVIAVLITLLLLIPVNVFAADAATSINSFAFNLYSKITEKDEENNIFFSPYSIYTALTMTYAGARGNTAEEIASVLHYSGLAENIHKEFDTLREDIINAEEQEYQLSVANALWGQQNYEFRKEFLDLIAEYYRGGFNEVDFTGETDKARNMINDWVLVNTGRKIKELLQSGDVTGDTVLILTNAIYFKGDWASQFKKELTEDKPFFVTPDNTVDVPMMFQENAFLYAEPNKDIQILELPYQGNNLSLVVILPRQGLMEFEKTLDAEAINNWLSGLTVRQVEVSLPRFNFNSRYSLREMLMPMGICDAFGEAADFSGMTRSQGLSISKVIHQADIDVNEEGTKAAAATAVVMGKSVQILTRFKADHPFVFLIRHRPTNTILFLGRLINPVE